MDDVTNLGGDAPEVEEVLIEEVSGGEAEQQDNPDGEPSEPELVEIERDGKTYKVPAELKDDFLRQADYTRKTQEIASLRKELEVSRDAVSKAGEAEVQAKAQAYAIQAALEQYQGVDWNALEAQDPQSAMRHWRQYSQLRDALEVANKSYDEAVQARQFETQREAAKRIEQGVAELQRDIPGWGPQLVEQLIAFGEQQGFSREYMQSVDDPKLVKLMFHAFKATKPVPPKPNQQTTPIRPAAKVAGGSSAPKTGLDDRLSGDEWLRRRNEQLAARRR